METIIIKIASIITALTVIIGCLIKLYKTIDKMTDAFEDIKDKLKEDRLSILKLIIINKEMPLDERVNAGEEYIKDGGNGSVHVLVDKLKEKYKKEIEKDG